MLLYGRQVQVNLLATISLRIAPESSRFAQGPGESARPVPSRLHTLGEQPGREPSCSLSKHSPARRCTGARSHPTVRSSDQGFETPAPWERAGLEWRTAGRQSRARSPQRPAGPGHTRKGRGEKGCSSGAGPVGEGDPARTLTHRLVRLLARAPRLAPLRCQPLTYPPEPLGPVRLHQDGERSAQAEEAWRAGTRGWEAGTVVLAAGDTADTTAAGSTQPRKLRALPPHRVPPPHPPPRLGATAVSTNQKPSAVRAGPT